METLKSGNAPALVTNIEVMEMLKKKIEQRGAEASGDLSAGKKRHSGKLRHRDWIEEQVIEYLQYSACVGMDIHNMPEFVSILKGKTGERDFDSPSTAKTMKSGDGNRSSVNDEHYGQQPEGFGLTDAETLQILNLMPKEVVDLHLIVEDLPSRLSDERQEDLLGLVAKYAGTSPEIADEEALAM